MWNIKAILRKVRGQNASHPETSASSASFVPKKKRKASEQRRSGSPTPRRPPLDPPSSWTFDSPDLQRRRSHFGDRLVWIGLGWLGGLVWFGLFMFVLVFGVLLLVSGALLLKFDMLKGGSFKCLRVLLKPSEFLIATCTCDLGDVQLCFCRVWFGLLWA